MATKKAAVKEHSVKDRLLTLYQLQSIDSEIDRLHTIRGELPLEVQDLEDEIAGLDTRIKKFQSEIEELEKKAQAIEDKYLHSASMNAKYRKIKDKKKKED